MVPSSRVKLTTGGEIIIILNRKLILFIILSVQINVHAGEYLDSLSKEFNIPQEKLLELKSKKIGINELNVLVEISKESGKSLDEIVEKSQSQGISKTIDDLGIKKDNFIKQIYERQNTIGQNLALPKSLPELKSNDIQSSAQPIPGQGGPLDGPQIKKPQPDQNSQDFNTPPEKNKDLNNQFFKNEMRAEFKENNFNMGPMNGPIMKDKLPPPPSGGYNSPNSGTSQPPPGGGGGGGGGGGPQGPSN